MRPLFEHPSFDIVGPGLRSTVQLTTGRRMHRLIIPCTNLTGALVERVRIRAGTDLLVDLTGAQLDIVNVSRDRATIQASNQIAIYFDRPGYLKQRAAIEDTALVTNTLSALTLEIDIASGASSPTLSRPIAYTSGAPTIDGQLVGQQRYTRYETYNWGFAGAGTFDLDNIRGNRDTHAAISAFWLSHGGNLTDFEIKANGADYFDKTPVSRLQRLMTDAGRPVISNVLYLDWAAEGFADVFDLSALSDLRMEATISDADQLTMVVEYLSLGIR